MQLTWSAPQSLLSPPTLSFTLTDIEEADEALAVAREVFEGVLMELPDDVRP